MEFNRCSGCMEPCKGGVCPHCGYDNSKPSGMEYALQPYAILAGKYVVGRVLGQGGFGITYIGWDLALERKVAIKEYYPSGQVSRSQGSQDLTWYTTDQARAARNGGMEMFLKEARKMVKVDGIPGIVRVLELFQENGTAYIVMEFVEGETLKAKLAKTGPLSWNQAKELFEPVIHTMGQVHRAGLVHRDLSPDNLMLTPDGGLRILDLGAAKDLSINSGLSSMQVAKSGFSPLEQYTQRGNSGLWTDVYAMGATIYYTLTGKLPPNAIDRLNRDTISWSEPGLSDLPPAVLATLAQALAVQITDRIQTMEELEQRLFSVSGDQQAVHHREELPEVAPMRKSYWKILLVAMILIGSLVVWLLLPPLGDGDSKNVRGEITRAAPGSTTKTAVTGNTEPESVPAETAPVFSMGSSQGSHYSNSFLGIQCTLDDSWEFLSDGEIRERNNISAEIIGEEYKKALEAANTLTDAMAQKKDSSDSVSVALEKLTKMESIVTESTYADYVKEGLSKALSDGGIENIVAKTEKITFAGELHYCVRISGTYMGTSVYETTVLMKCKNYMAAINVGTLLTDGTDQILNCFSPL